MFNDCFFLFLVADHNLSEEQLINVNQINKKILLRSSYGVLFVQGNKVCSIGIVCFYS
jgi:hypothetical protein